MTIILKHKEYKGNDGRTWFVEQYREKLRDGSFSYPFWRYGILINGLGYIKSDMLWNRPNIKTHLKEN